MIVSGSVAWETRGKRGEEGCGALRESFRSSDDRKRSVQIDGFGRRERRAEEEDTDTRDPAVSENREEKRACAGVLTRVQAGRGKRRKGKGKKRKAFRKGKFSFLFLI